MISYYELLGLIKEDKQPDKVKYGDTTYMYVGNTYMSNNDVCLTLEIGKLYADNSLISIKSIEIIEDKPKKIEEIKFKTIEDAEHLEMKCKISELTKAVNYLLEEEDKHE